MGRGRRRTMKLVGLVVDECLPRAPTRQWTSKPIVPRTCVWSFASVVFMCAAKKSATSACPSGKVSKGPVSKLRAS